MSTNTIPEDSQATPAVGPRLERGVGRLAPERATATPLMRSMLKRAGHIGVGGKEIVTEWVGRRCVQCIGRMVQRRTLDGWQPVAAFSWLIDSRRASKADVWRLTSKTPNVRGEAGRPPGA